MNEPAKYRILVVDDHELSCKQLIETLRQNPYYDVNDAKNGAVALPMLREKSYDVALLDLRMPKMDGMELLKYINILKLPVAVIVITGHGSIAEAVQAMKLGAYDFLTKPVELDHLRLIIDRLLRERGGAVGEIDQLATILYDQWCDWIDRALKRSAASKLEGLKRLVDISYDDLEEGDKQDFCRMAVTIVRLIENQLPNAQGTDRRLLLDLTESGFSLNHATMSESAKTRILVVEDHNMTREQLIQILRRIPHFDVDGAENGDVALPMLRQNSYDVALLDLRMPKMDGMELLNHIDILKLPVAVIVITGHGSINEAVQAMRLGAYDFITKPVELDQLRHTIDRFLGERVGAVGGIERIATALQQPWCECTSSVLKCGTASVMDDEKRWACISYHDLEDSCKQAFRRTADKLVSLIENVLPNIPVAHRRLLPDLMGFGFTGPQVAAVNLCDEKSQRHGFRALTNTERIVFLVSSANYQIECKGLVDFYLSSVGDHAFETVRALEAIGALNAAAELKAANALFRNGLSVNIVQRLKSVKRLEEKLTKRFSKSFHTKWNEVSSKLQSYIDEHSTEFACPTTQNDIDVS